MSQDTRITASMCSHSPRIQLLKKSVTSIINQVDRLNIYLNDIDIIPSFLHHPNVHVVLSKDTAGDIGSNGKFFWAEETIGYQLIIDDDIIYPPNYAQRIIAKINEYDRCAAICVFGTIIAPHAPGYDAAFTLNMTKGFTQDVQVHLPGNGTLGFHSDTMQPSMTIFENPNMDDVYLGKFCRKHGIPVYAMQREPLWLRPAGYRNDHCTLWKTHRKQASALIADEAPWPALPHYRVRKIPPSLFFRIIDKSHLYFEYCRYANLGLRKRMSYRKVSIDA